MEIIEKIENPALRDMAILTLANSTALNSFVTDMKSFANKVVDKMEGIEEKLRTVDMALKDRDYEHLKDQPNTIMVLKFIHYYQNLPVEQKGGHIGVNIKGEKVFVINAETGKKEQARVGYTVISCGLVQELMFELFPGAEMSLPKVKDAISHIGGMMEYKAKPPPSLHVVVTIQKDLWYMQKEKFADLINTVASSDSFRMYSLDPALSVFTEKIRIFPRGREYRNREKWTTSVPAHVDKLFIVRKKKSGRPTKRQKTKKLELTEDEIVKLMGISDVSGDLRDKIMEVLIQHYPKTNYDEQMVDIDIYSLTRECVDDILAVI